MNASWSRGVLIGLPLAAVFLVALLLTSALLIRWARRNSEDYDSGLAFWLGIGAAGGALVLVIGTGWAMYPWSGDYHRWETKSGTVTDVTSRILSSDNSVSQKFVVRYEDGQEYGCNDTRCSLIKVGDRLTLTCKRTWQFTGRDGWDCNYVGRQS